MENSSKEKDEKNYHDVSIGINRDFSWKTNIFDSLINRCKKIFKSSKKLLTKKRLYFIIGGLIIFAAALICYTYLSSVNKSTVATVNNPPVTDTRIALPAPRATQTINRTFSFPLTDSTGKVVSNIQYTVDTVQEMDEILIKGEKATAIKGKTFLVVNLKLANDFVKPIQIQSIDYIRLTVGNSPDQLAPDMHNDPVLVQASSTKLTRVGFTVDDTAKNMKLLIGEINGTKTPIDLQF